MECHVMEHNAVDAKSHRNYAYLAVILAIAACVRFVGLGWASVWEDELTWMNLARTDGPLALIRELPRQDAGGSPLHLLLLQAWLKYVADSIVSARFASAICGLSAVALVFAIGRRFYDTPTGLHAAWLAALNPLDVHHSREVRAYPWLVLLTCAGWYLLVSFSHSAAAWKRGLYTLVLILLLYTHPLGALTVAALAVGYLATTRETALGRKSWIVMNLIAAAAFAPWVTRHLDHVPQIELKHWTAWILLGWTEGFTGGNLGAFVAAWALIVFGLAWHRLRAWRSGLEMGASLCLAWFLVPTLLLIAYSLVSHSIFGPRRYLLFVGPAYLLLIARGISLLPRASIRFMVLTTLTLMAGTTIVSRSFAVERADWQGAASMIRAKNPRAPVVIMDHERRRMHRACLGYYLAPQQQPISVEHELSALAASPPESLWFVIETANWNTAVPIPDDLTRRYVAERTWMLRGVTLVQARIRETEAVSHRDDTELPLERQRQRQ
jgi:mannosyltransferase